MEAERANTRLEPARCLVIGGGLLGSHVARELVRNGHTASVYSRSFSDWLLAERELGLEVELVPGEIPPGRGLDELVSDAEIVLLGRAPGSRRRTRSVDLGSLTPALSVMDRCAADVRRIAIASSGGPSTTVDELPTSEVPTRRSPAGVTRSRSRVRRLLCARLAAAADPAFLDVFGPGERVLSTGRGGHLCDALSRGLPSPSWVTEAWSVTPVRGGAASPRHAAFATEGRPSSVGSGRAIRCASPGQTGASPSQSQVRSSRRALDSLLRGLTLRLRQATGWSASRTFPPGSRLVGWALRRNSDAAVQNAFSDQPAAEEPRSLSASAIAARKHPRIAPRPCAWPAAPIASRRSGWSCRSRSRSAMESGSRIGTT